MRKGVKKVEKKAINKKLNIKTLLEFNDIIENLSSWI